MLEREVVEVAQVLDSDSPKVFELMDGWLHFRCTRSSGVFVVLDGVAYLFGREWSYIGVQLMLPVDF